MPSLPDRLLDAAREHLGYREKASGYTIFGDWYYANVDKSDPYFKNAPWCDMFITWAATQAGIEEYVGDFAYTVDHAKWFKKQDAWSDQPEPGAIVFYDWSGSRDLEAIDHAGIVERVEGEKIFTIEGNVDKVWLKRKERDQGNVVGYGLPRKVQRNLEGEEEQDSAVLSVNPAQGAGLEGQFTTIPMVVRAQADAAPSVRTVEGAVGPGAALVGVISVAMVMALMRNRRPPSGRHARHWGRHRTATA